MDEISIVICGDFRCTVIAPIEHGIKGTNILAGNCQGFTIRCDIERECQRLDGRSAAGHSHSSRRQSTSCYS
jgi:hypothetical protein